MIRAEPGCGSVFPAEFRTYASLLGFAWRLVVVPPLPQSCNMPGSRIEQNGSYESFMFDIYISWSWIECVTYVPVRISYCSITLRLIGLQVTDVG